MLTLLAVHQGTPSDGHLNGILARGPRKVHRTGNVSIRLRTTDKVGVGGRALGEVCRAIAVGRDQCGGSALREICVWRATVVGIADGGVDAGHLAGRGPSPRQPSGGGRSRLVSDLQGVTDQVVVRDAIDDTAIS